MHNTVKDTAAKREVERLRAENERQMGIIDYVAMMADVEIPTEDERDKKDE